MTHKEFIEKYDLADIDIQTNDILMVIMANLSDLQFYFAMEPDCHEKINQIKRFISDSKSYLKNHSKS